MALTMKENFQMDTEVHQRVGAEHKAMTYR